MFAFCVSKRSRCSYFRPNSLPDPVSISQVYVRPGTKEELASFVHTCTFVYRHTPHTYAAPIQSIVLRPSSSAEENYRLSAFHCVHLVLYGAASGSWPGAGTSRLISLAGGAPAASSREPRCLCLCLCLYLYLVLRCQGARGQVPTASGPSACTPLQCLYVLSRYLYMYLRAHLQRRFYRTSACTCTAPAGTLPVTGRPACYLMLQT